MAVLALEMLPTSIVVDTAGWGKIYSAIFGIIDRLYLFLVLPVVFGYMGRDAEAAGGDGGDEGLMGFSSVFAAFVVCVYVMSAACIELLINTGSGKGRSYGIIHSVVFVLLWAFLVFCNYGSGACCHYSRSTRRADTAHMVFITWLAGAYGFLPVAVFLQLVGSRTSDSEMILVYVGWLAFVALVKELWKTSLSWASDPAAGFTGDFSVVPDLLVRGGVRRVLPAAVRRLLLLVPMGGCDHLQVVRAGQRRVFQLDEQRSGQHEPRERRRGAACTATRPSAEAQEILDGSVR